jgi:hypothetical protein
MESRSFYRCVAFLTPLPERAESLSYKTNKIGRCFQVGQNKNKCVRKDASRLVASAPRWFERRSPTAADVISIVVSEPPQRFTFPSCVCVCACVCVTPYKINIHSNICLLDIICSSPPHAAPPSRGRTFMCRRGRRYCGSARCDDMTMPGM